MIKINKGNQFGHENDFYLTCSKTRLNKPIIHYELLKAVKDVEGEIVECGIFKGTSLKRFIMYRDMIKETKNKIVIGFDTFGDYPITKFKPDRKTRAKFINDAGSQSIGKEQLKELLKQQDLYENVELVKGDILQTVPKYVKDNPDLKIALLNLDTDIYEPAVTTLKYLWDKISVGGILISDDYGVFAGETKAINDFFKDKNIEIKYFDFCKAPCYIKKEAKK